MKKAAFLGTFVFFMIVMGLVRPRADEAIIIIHGHTLFGIVTDTEAAQVHIVNILQPPKPTTPCEAEVKFFDSAGMEISDATCNKILRGNSIQTCDFDPAVLGQPEGRNPYVAQVKVMGRSARQCVVLIEGEIYDPNTGNIVRGQSFTIEQGITGAQDQP